MPFFLQGSSIEKRCWFLLVLSLIQLVTMHMATLSTGIIGYIEIPVTTVTPSCYRIHDLNTLCQFEV